MSVSRMIVLQLRGIQATVFKLHILRWGRVAGIDTVSGQGSPPGQVVLGEKQMGRSKKKLP